MKNRFVSILCILITAGVLGACGKNDGNPDTNAASFNEISGGEQMEKDEASIVGESYEMPDDEELKQENITSEIISQMGLADDTMNQTSNQEARGEKTENEEKRILIAYFTWAENTVLENAAEIDADATTSASLLLPGNTAQMAAWIQQKTGGELFSIRVTEPYASDYDECLSRASEEKSNNARPALSGYVSDMESYDVIFIGYPNWWYTCPMAIFSFIEQYDLSGKIIIPFCAYGTGGLASSVQDMKRALPDSVVLEAMGLSRDEVSGGKDKITEWVDQLNF